MKVIRILVVAVLAALFATVAFSQTETGQISGTVTDPQGAVVPNATVTVSSATQGTSRSTTSNADGLYTVTNLQPDTYKVTVKSSNFAEAAKNVDVTVGSRNTLNFPLQVSGSSTTVEVVGQGGISVNTESAQLSQEISGTQITEYPTLDRNPYGLINTTGSVAGDANGSTGRGVGVAINGQRAASTSILLDGSENVDTFTASLGQVTPLDSVKQFRVINSNFTAEYGRATGGVVSVATKSGTNALHGSAYEYYRGSATAANLDFNNANGTPRPRYDRNQFGYSVGGPIIKDKLFFFTSTEWTRVRSAAAVHYFVPDPAFIAASAPATQSFMTAYGDLTGSTPTGVVLTKASNSALSNGSSLGTAPAAGPWTTYAVGAPVFDEVTRQLATDAGGGNPQDSYDLVGRFDWNLTDRTSAYGRYAVYSQEQFSGSNSASPYGAFNTGITDFDNNVDVSLTHIWSNSVVSQDKVVFNRLNNSQPLNGPPTPTLFWAKTSLSGTGVATPLPGYLPLSPGSAIPFGGPQNLLQTYNDLSWTKGKHSFRFGGQYIYLRDNRAFGAYEEANEQLTSSSMAKSFNDFLGGNLQKFTVAVNPQGANGCVLDPVTLTRNTTDPGCNVSLPVSLPQFSRSNRYSDWAAYAQDTWKIMPTVTLNLGVRYEYYGVQHNKDPNLDANFFYGSGSTFFQQYRNGQTFRVTDPNSPQHGLWNPDYNNFAPRLGFAWDVFGNGKTSLRGGYAVSYERNFGNVTFNMIQNPPNYAVVNLTNAGGPIPIATNNFGPFAGSTPPSKPLITPGIRHVDQNIRTAYIHQWDLSVEHELARNTVLSVEYSGSHGLKEYTLDLLNRPGSGIIYAGDSSAAALANPLRDYLNLRYGFSAFHRENAGFNYYHGLNVRLATNDFHNTGLSFTANYTYSHAIDNLSSTFSDSSANYNTGLLDPNNPTLDKGNADFDIRHRFVVSALWAEPFWKSSPNRFAKDVLGGWEISTIVSASTGTPFTIFDCANAFLFCARLQANGPVAGNGNVALTPVAGNPDQFNYLQYDATNVGAIVNPLIGTSDFGPGCTTPGSGATAPCSWPAAMLGRNTERGPGRWGTDLAINKNIAITERYSLQFQTQFLSVFNHPNQYLNAGNLDASACSVLTACSITTQKGSIPGNVTGDNRNLTFSLKFIF